MFRSEREQARLTWWHGQIMAAAEMFERRWSLRALQRVDPELHRLLLEQRDLTGDAMVRGELAEVDRQAAAMVRGWNAARAAMEAASAPDDAYFVGVDHKTGTRVAIGERAAAGRVAEVHGQRCILVTPDEVATMMAGLEGFKTIAAIKNALPGAEIIDIYPDQPARGDSGLDHPAAGEEG